MPRVAYLKRLYALAGASWFAFWAIKLLTAPSADRNPNPLGLVYCLLLFAGLPSLGYVLLFIILPWTGRRLRRS
ncbi:MAG: hypothetical protein LAP40_03515 [Acidobacteriia bacterium]|nr:hypothetical protein [Terriglobia bacterium]